MEWKSVSRAVVVILLSCAGVANLVAQGSGESFRLLFPHYAAGKGFSTVFTFMNSGSTVADGFLTLHDPDGKPRTPVQIRIPAQGLSSFAVWRATGAIPISGWAEYVGSGGDVTGTATFQLNDAHARPVSIAGMPSADLAQHIRIPVEVSLEDSTYSGYAIANPGSAPINVSLSVFDENGSPLGEILRLTLPPGRQVVRFLHEDLATLDSFLGSLVITSGDSPFIAISLAEMKGLYTTVPVVSKPLR